ncbi:hypothetical protein N7478_011807 [Penicillium angulare]|uniref:uncharacterized protein n=1 Tax=Penicillium angulare TaxID=116970 RepID=UPI002541974E|nr:uncharacterized protein N7478_011807 [Penicillium angulare]KAJ5261212.1 hypothetical protein N7478_011807 [Penicillium angulare]
MSLCEDCGTWDLDKKGSFDVVLGKYEDLVTKSDNGCESCRLFCSILQTSGQYEGQLKKLAGQDIAFCNVRPDAREPGFIGMAMSWDDLCLDICMAGNYEGIKRHVHANLRVLMIENSRAAHRTIGSLHDVAGNSQDDKCVTKISSWMSQCAEHQKCHQFEPVSLPERTIEVSSDPRVASCIIASGGENGAYIILSHHHSADSASSNTKELPKASLPDVFDTAHYPKAVADAADITRRLVYQYLWIWQLCLTTKESSKNPANFLGINGRASLMLTASLSSEPNLGSFIKRYPSFSSIGNYQRRVSQAPCAALDDEHPGIATL